jgi:hypothetical protein
MKKLYSFILLALPFLSVAQSPTIQQSDEPVVNLIFGTAIDDNYSAAIPSGGANQTWDYSNLQFADTGGGRFLSAAWTPNAPTFAPANLAVYDSLSDAYAYFTANSSGFYANGFDSSGKFFVLNPPLLYVPVPFTYSDTRSSTARLQFDTVYMGNPIRIVHTSNDDFEADGYGTLIVPGNTFTNTLRIKVKEVTIDSVFTDVFGNWIYTTRIVSQQHFYRWVRHSGPDVFLLEIQADSLGTTATRSEYQIGSLISVPEAIASNQHLKSYPNPVTDVIQIDFGVENGNTGTIEIYNSVGELITSRTFNNVNRYVLYVNTFQNGLYYFIVNSTDNKVRRGTFIVNH